MNSKNVSQLPPCNQSTFQTFHLSRKVLSKSAVESNAASILLECPLFATCTRTVSRYYNKNYVDLFQVPLYLIVVLLLDHVIILLFRKKVLGRNFFFYLEVIPFVVLLSIHPFPPKINILWKIKISYLHHSIVQKDKF